RRAHVPLTHRSAGLITGRERARSSEGRPRGGPRPEKKKKAKGRKPATAGRASRRRGLAARLVPAIDAFNLTAVQNRGGYTRAAAPDPGGGNGLPGDAPMKFGVFDHMDDAGGPLGQLYADRLELVEAYDRSGSYGYHLAEHHSTPLGCAASPGLFLAAMTQRTKTLRFGPLVYLLPFYHPLRLIEEICMLDQMSGGRLELGIGRGVSPFETRAYGLDFAQ